MPCTRNGWRWPGRRPGPMERGGPTGCCGRSGQHRRPIFTVNPRSDSMKRVVVALATTALTAAAFSPTPAAVQARPVAMTVYKSPTCGCCRKWVDMMKTAGFAVTAHDIDDVEPVKDKQHVPGDLRSCHTAVVGGYVVEGHVPADLIHKMLREHPRIAGLSVPGMVTGSPGMEGGTREPYDVVSFDAAGKAAVYAKR